MKNLKDLINFQDRESFLKNIWHTEEFKESYLNKGYIYQKTKNFMNLPRLIAEPTEIKIEHSHFYSYLNILILKNYDNKTIQDLYYLHEIFHIASMPYQKDLSFQDWSFKMINNELEASLESEVIVYQHLKIREKSFDFPIWYDTLEKNISKSDLLFLRAKALIDPKNNIEKNISKYLDQNKNWCNLWKDSFEKIENLMVDFQQSQDLLLLKSFIQNNEENNIPFYQKALLFSEEYFKNNKKV